MKLSDEQIGAELAALRETPSERFAAELDAWAAAGFPSAKEFEAPKPRFAFLNARPRMLAFAGGAAIALLVAISVTAYLKNSNDVQLFSGESKGGDQGALLSAPAPSQSVPESATATGTAAARPRNDRQQVQERTASLGLATDSDKLQDAADGVIDVTDRYDGFVDSSNIHANGDRGRATFSLRIPTQHLNDALADLSDLGRVTNRDLGSTNVTGSYVDAGKAYNDAQANVDDLREQLSKASTRSEAVAIRAQLDVARQQLTAAREALRNIKGRVALTPVSVQITAQGDGSWTIGDAADDAVGVLEAIAGAALITLAVLVPLAALIALGWLGTRELNRRRREAALNR